MHSPDFWTKDGIASKLLCPLSYLWQAGAKWRTKTTQTRTANCPVFCVGNFTVGGAGKTPTAIALSGILEQLGLKAHFLSRGYGGKLEGPHQVNPDQDIAEDVGDEPLLLAHYGTTWISRDRGLGAELACQNGAQAIILDDGLQNPSLLKNCSFAVIDSGYGIGNGKVMPAGPLREPLQDGLERVHALILIGDETPAFLDQISASLPIIRARVRPANGDQFARQRVVAFAGIGRPQKFYNSLSAVGAEIIQSFDFDDHHPYSESEISNLRETAHRQNARLVTTEKDLMRLPKAMRSDIGVLAIRLELEAPEELEHIIKMVLSDGQA